MAKPFQVTISPAIADDNAFANNIAGTYDGTNTVYIPTITTTSDGLAHTVLITNTTAINLSSTTLTINGTNFNGDAQSETINGPDTLDEVSTTLYFLTVTSVVINNFNNGNNTLNLGINSDAISPPYPIDWTKNQLEVNIETEITGFSLQYSRSPDYNPTLETSIQNIPSDEWIWVDWVASNPNIYETLYSPVNIRFFITEYSEGQSLSFCASQSRLT